jgi:diadenosine tetraphosphate (Ap4A) HIT family hydrolase
LNIAALGNVVPQLHIHHIVRYTDDPSWSVPVRGAVPAMAYTERSLEAVLDKPDRARLPDFEFGQDK